MYQGDLLDLLEGPTCSFRDDKVHKGDRQETTKCVNLVRQRFYPRWR